jgi:hypothetical protein
MIIVVIHFSLRDYMSAKSRHLERLHYSNLYFKDSALATIMLISTNCQLFIPISGMK